MTPRQRFYLQLVALCLAFSLLVGSSMLFMMHELNGQSARQIRNNIYLPAVRLLESEPFAASLQHYDTLMVDVPMLRCRIWILDDNGGVVASNTSLSPPARWRNLPRPARVHDMSFGMQWNRSNPDMVLIRLDRPAPTYALFKRKYGVPAYSLLTTQMTFFILLSAGSLVVGLRAISLYQRKNAEAARRVLARIRQGDLKARFISARFDQIGELMLEFNAMADEIERLVKQLQEIESTKRKLLQELSHDLRTPLTSLTTAIDILAEHNDALSESERKEMFAIARGELDYFRRLIEDLFFIADIESSSQRDLTQPVDLRCLVEAEVVHRKRALEFGDACQNKPLQWLVQLEEATVAGDTYLLNRLLKNVIQNAIRFAATTIHISTQTRADEVILLVQDDGPGMNADAIRCFGLHRQRRIELQSHSGIDVSMGLGSIIMRTIADLHQASIKIDSALTNPEIPAGTRFQFVFHRCICA